MIKMVNVIVDDNNGALYHDPKVLALQQNPKDAAIHNGQLVVFTSHHRITTGVWMVRKGVCVCVCVC